MQINVLGTGNAFDALSPNSSFVFSVNEQLWLFDCGPTIPQQLWSSGYSDEVDVIYISHIHSDHCSGISILFNYFCAIDRKKPLTFICQDADVNQLKTLIEFGTQYEESIPFDIHWFDVSASVVNGIKIETAKTIHSVSNYSLLVNDLLFISGDGKPSASSISLMSKAKVVLHECSDVDDGGPGHASVKELLEVEKQINTRMYLYHFNSTKKNDLIEATQYTDISILDTNQKIVLNDE